MTMIDTHQIPGYGIDVRSRRPGVPKEKSPPEPLAGAIQPQLQDSDVNQLTHGAGKALPPVYGTAQPPRGLAGKVRGIAYSYPDHILRHWALLLLADRIDLWEHRIFSPRGALAIGALLLLGGGGAMALAMRRTRRVRDLPLQLAIE